MRLLEYSTLIAKLAIKIVDIQIKIIKKNRFFKMKLDNLSHIIFLYKCLGIN